MMNSETHKVIQYNNLMYKGCEPHWKCIKCGNYYPFHCYTKEEIESLPCVGSAGEIVPKEFKKLLKTVVNRARKNATDIKKVEDYYVNNFGLSVEDLRSGDGCSLEEFEYGNYPIEEFEEYVKDLINQEINKKEKQI